MATGERHWYIVVCYLALGGGVMIWDMGEAITELPRGLELIVAGDIYVNLEGTEGQERYEEIMTAVAASGLKDILRNLIPRHRTW